MNYRKSCKLFFGLVIILSTMLSSTFVLANQQVTHSAQLLIDDDPTIRKVPFLKSGVLGALMDYDSYHLQLKKDVEYFCWANIKITEGTFLITAVGAPDFFSASNSWNSSTPNRKHVVKLTFFASHDGEYTISVSTVGASEEGKYTLYINKAGFAGIWWMVLIPIVVLLLIFSLIYFLRVRKRRKKRRPRKRKR
ncbi:hypothetical protein DRO91_08440 [Candidatus Heimdallarchaeota archaeon]|nr:MAG: hypothetical protein DRO63_05225 [Candidatus Gerdarchaeota archaeon]RLI68883.1 MAG: hypothetical protein DRO91_08440 [Candidatus Heimdallarchaeota archaeon]